MRLAGLRNARSREESNVSAAAGVASILGATPPVTVTSSLTADSTARESSASSFSMTTGLATCPPGRIMTTVNGGRGSGLSVNRPCASVVATVVEPTTVIVAPAIGALVSRLMSFPSDAPAAVTDPSTTAAA